MLIELNEKEYEILKKILKEDTDDWDEADMPVGRASTEYRDKTIETTVDSLEDLDPKTSFALKKNLGGGYA